MRLLEVLSRISPPSGVQMSERPVDAVPRGLDAPEPPELSADERPPQPPHADHAYDSVRQCLISVN